LWSQFLKKLQSSSTTHQPQPTSVKQTKTNQDIVTIAAKNTPHHNKHTYQKIKQTNKNQNITLRREGGGSRTETTKHQGGYPLYYNPHHNKYTYQENKQSKRNKQKTLKTPTTLTPILNILIIALIPLLLINITHADTNSTSITGIANCTQDHRCYIIDTGTSAGTYIHADWQWQWNQTTDINTNQPYKKEKHIHWNTQDTITESITLTGWYIQNSATEAKYTHANETQTFTTTTISTHESNNWINTKDLTISQATLHNLSGITLWDSTMEDLLVTQTEKEPKTAIKNGYKLINITPQDSTPTLTNITFQTTIPNTIQGKEHIKLILKDKQIDITPTQNTTTCNTDQPDYSRDTTATLDYSQKTAYDFSTKTSLDKTDTREADIIYKNMPEKLTAPNGIAKLTFAYFDYTDTIDCQTIAYTTSTTDIEQGAVYCLKTKENSTILLKITKKTPEWDITFKWKKSSGSLNIKKAALSYNQDNNYIFSEEHAHHDTATNNADIHYDYMSHIFTAPHGIKKLSSGTHNPKECLTASYGSSAPINTGTTYCLKTKENNYAILKVTGSTQYLNVTFDWLLPRFIQVCKQDTDSDGTIDYFKVKLATLSSKATYMIGGKTNMLPVITGAELHPQTAYTTTDITCENSTVSDPENDSVTLHHRWYKNNIIQPTITAKTLSSAFTSKGETWKCEIIPGDSHGNGAGAISQSITIANTPPSAPGWLSPNTTTTDRTPLLEWSSSTDADNDNINYWIMLGTEQGLDNIITLRNWQYLTNYLIPFNLNYTTYYYRITASDSEENTTTKGSFNITEHAQENKNANSNTQQTTSTLKPTTTSTQTPAAEKENENKASPKQAISNTTKKDQPNPEQKTAPSIAPVPEADTKTITQGTSGTIEFTIENTGAYISNLHINISKIPKDWHYEIIPPDTQELTKNSILKVRVKITVPKNAELKTYELELLVKGNTHDMETKTLESKTYINIIEAEKTNTPTAYSTKNYTKPAFSLIILTLVSLILYSGRKIFQKRPPTNSYTRSDLNIIKKRIRRQKP